MADWNFMQIVNFCGRDDWRAHTLVPGSFPIHVIDDFGDFFPDPPYYIAICQTVIVF